MSLRCFIALDVDTRVRGACDGARRSLIQLKPALRDQKWVAARNLHITLAFFGDVEPDRTSRLIKGLTRVLDRSGPITLSHPHLTAKPSAPRASMIWVSFDDPNGEFAAVATALAKAGSGSLGRCRDTDETPRPGPRESKHVPHLTLCRLRTRQSIAPTVLTTPQQAFHDLAEPMSYPRATLYSSRLAPQGPTYSELFVWHMRGE